MRKLLITFLAFGVIFLLSSTRYADAVLSYPSSISVDSWDHSCFAYNDCPKADRTYPDSTIIEEFFPLGQYRFTVSSGYWESLEANGTSYPTPKGFWSMNIFNVDTGGDFAMLGNYTPYSSGAAALAGHTTPAPEFITYDVTHDNGSGGSVLGFYIEDDSPRGNLGTVTANIAVVPEPVSTTLFVIGGLVLGGRGYIRRKKKN